MRVPLRWWLLLLRLLLLRLRLRRLLLRWRLLWQLLLLLLQRRSLLVLRQCLLSRWRLLSRRWLLSRWRLLSRRRLLLRRLLVLCRWLRVRLGWLLLAKRLVSVERDIRPLTLARVLAIGLVALRLTRSLARSAAWSLPLSLGGRRVHPPTSCTSAIGCRVCRHMNLAQRLVHLFPVLFLQVFHGGHLLLHLRLQLRHIRRQPRNILGMLRFQSLQLVLTLH